METRANLWTRVPGRPWSTSTISSLTGCFLWMSGNRQKPTSRRSRLLMKWGLSQRNVARTQLSPFRPEFVVQVLPQVRCLFTLPVLSFVVISGGSRAGTCLACLEVMILPTAAGGFAKDMITAVVLSWKCPEPCFFLDFDSVQKKTGTLFFSILTQSGKK